MKLPYFEGIKVGYLNGSDAVSGKITLFNMKVFNVLTVAVSLGVIISLVSKIELKKINFVTNSNELLNVVV